jgi:hypothetical protein
VRETERRALAFFRTAGEVGARRGEKMKLDAGSICNVNCFWDEGEISTAFHRKNRETDVWAVNTFIDGNPNGWVRPRTSPIRRATRTPGPPLMMPRDAFLSRNVKR